MKPLTCPSCILPIKFLKDVLKAPVGKMVFSPIPNSSNTDVLWLQVGLDAIQKRHLMSWEWDSTVINCLIIRSFTVNTTLVQPLLKRRHILIPLFFWILNPFLSPPNDDEWSQPRKFTANWTTAHLCNLCLRVDEKQLHLANEETHFSWQLGRKLWGWVQENQDGPVID